MAVDAARAPPARASRMRASPAGASRKVSRKCPPSGCGARPSRRMTSAAARAGGIEAFVLEPVLARTDLGEHLGRRVPGESDLGGDFGQVCAQERIGGFLGAEPRGNRRPALGDEPRHLALAGGELRIVGLDGAGETDIGLRIFVTAINMRVV